jgi:hypothetical protein
MRLDCSAGQGIEKFWETVVDPNRETLPNDELPLKVLLYRYFWPFWLFLDATHGNLYARAHASRHNREMSVYLPTYLKRWGVLCLITLTTVFACDRIEKHAELYKEIYAALVAGAGMAFTWCFAIACIIASIYARLRFE